MVVVYTEQEEALSTKFRNQTHSLQGTLKKHP